MESSFRTTACENTCGRKPFDGEALLARSVAWLDGGRSLYCWAQAAVGLLLSASIIIWMEGGYDTIEALFTSPRPPPAINGLPEGHNLRTSFGLARYWADELD